jgi:ATP-dependent exoDNAse (exonuclease V) beta subunit
LTAILGRDRHATLWERLCDDAALAPLAAPTRLRVQRLRAALDAGGDTDLAQRVERAWLLLGGPAACAQATDLAHARAFFDALAQWSQEPDWTGPQQLPERLERLFAAHQAGAANPVQVMTIHRAKGLEFDHVILPGLGRRRRRNERQLLQWLDLPRGTRGSDLLMVAVPPTAAAGPTALGRYVSQLQQQRELHEATRLLYVAATRARLQLHLFGQLDAPRPGRPAPRPASGTLLERLWPALKEQFPTADDTAATAMPDQLQLLAPAAAPLERLAADWSLPQLPPRPQPQALAVAAYEPARAGASGSDQVERAVCEVLRRLARRRQGLGEDAELLQQLTQRLQRLGSAPADVAAQSLLGLELLQACREDARLQWIFTNLRAPAARPEVPLALTGLYEGRLTSIQADLSFVDPGGTRWLIDIAPLPPAGPDATEAAFALRLSRTLHLAAALKEGPARAAVYLPAAQLFCQRTL